MGSLRKAEQDWQQASWYSVLLVTKFFVGKEQVSWEQASWEQTSWEQTSWEQASWEQTSWEQASWEQASWLFVLLEGCSLCAVSVGSYVSEKVRSTSVRQSPGHGSGCGRHAK